MRSHPLGSPAIVVLAVTLLLPLLTLGSVDAPAPRVTPSTPAFQRTWARTNQPTADGAVSRTWMCGPEASNPARSEAYTEAPGGQRQVQ